MSAKKPGRRSPTYEEAVQMCELLLKGEQQMDVACVFDYNIGRVSEVKTGKRHPGAMAEAKRRRLH